MYSITKKKKPSKFYLYIKYKQLFEYTDNNAIRKKKEKKEKHTLVKLTEIQHNETRIYLFKKALLNHLL